MRLAAPQLAFVPASISNASVAVCTVAASACCLQRRGGARKAYPGTVGGRTFPGRYVAGLVAAEWPQYRPAFACATGQRPVALHADMQVLLGICRACHGAGKLKPGSSLRCKLRCLYFDVSKFMPDDAAQVANQQAPALPPLARADPCRVAVRMALCRPMALQ